MCTSCPLDHHQKWLLKPIATKNCTKWEREGKVLKSWSRASLRKDPYILIGLLDQVSAGETLNQSSDLWHDEFNLLTALRKSKSHGGQCSDDEEKLHLERWTVQILFSGGLGELRMPSLSPPDWWCPTKWVAAWRDAIIFRGRRARTNTPVTDALIMPRNSLYNFVNNKRAMPL